MSTRKSSAGTLLPDTYGTAKIIDCDSCGKLDFSPREVERFERMVDFHRAFCAGTIETHEPSAPGPKR